MTFAPPRPSGGTPESAPRPSRSRVVVTALSLLVALLVAPARASAAPEAHILRIDPRASMSDGAPVLTTVLELVQNKRMSDVTGKCAQLTGDAALDCIASALEQPGALYSSFDFPEKNGILTVTVDGSDLPAKFESKARWSDSSGQAGTGVGTAWLILVDAAASMGPRFEEAKHVAGSFINAMGPNDIVDVMLFNDKGVVQDSKWVASKPTATATLAAVPHTYPSQGRTRPLFTILKQAATDGFKELGNAGQSIAVPMHQAMVVLSNGSAGADASSNAAAANILKDYLTKGRFPENNDVLPMTPVPVVSIWFPTHLVDEFAANAREFMEALANNEIGGFYSIVRDGQQGRAANIVNSVRTRFNKMHIVKWRVSCIAPSITQVFKLVFPNTSPQIQGDATFKNVPVGIDPTTWPLDIDHEATERAAKKEPIYPGGSVKVFGNFCWGGNATRAEIYMMPKNQSPPATLSGSNIDEAKKAQRTLIEAGMRGKATSAGDSVVEFDLPSNAKFLVGKGDNVTARMVLYDNQARRTSAITADKILTLRAREAPLPYLIIGGATFAGVVLVLLVVSIVRGGGRRRGGGGGSAGLARPVNMAGMAAVGAGGIGPGYGGAGYGGPGTPPPGPIGSGAPLGGDMGYGAPPAPGAGVGGYGGSSSPTRGVIAGAAGVFTVTAGLEMRVGRDGATCQILLTEPRVSGNHATLKFEAGQLLVRDETSNNGTYLNGQRISAAMWTPVAPGTALRFGPVEFAVRLE
jgi:FHA domain